MTDTQRFQQIAELFESARTRSGQDREWFLREACSNDPDLLARVRGLLTHHETDDAPLATPVVPEGITIDMFPPPTAPPIPEAIGRYRVQRQLGIGGMGVVYLAEQDRPHRRVAVKVIRPGVLSRNLLKRFEFEAQALARLQHPGIAQIYEVGAFHDGAGQRPFFAMELIEGQPLLTHADQQQLDTRQRLELFLRVCDAVHHAHQRGVVHRDIKPANILIDATGQPKVLDFGVARATDADLQVTTLQTSTGQLIGTLPYMSPEQLAGRETEVDVRSDVYALGVTLYELLSGRLPHDLADTNLLSAARKIVDTDPTALSSVRPAYRGDLNTIVLKALERDPGRRYQAASALAADLRRFLEHEPIVARPATAVYQLRMFAQRHKGFVLGLAAACVILVAGIAGVVWQASQARTEATTRREVADFLRDLLTSVDPARAAGEEPTVRALLDDASVRLDESFETAPLVSADLHETIGETYHALGDYRRAEHHLRTTAEAYRAAFGDADDRTLGVIASLGITLREMDRLDEAEALLTGSVHHARANHGPGAEKALINLAIILRALGRSDEAEAAFVEVYQRDLVDFGPDHFNTLCARANLAGFLIGEHRFEDALSHIEPACKALRQTVGDDHPKTIAAIANFGAVLANLGRFEDGYPLLEEAVERSDRVLGPTHLHTLRRRQNLIRTHWQRGDADEAQSQARELLMTCQRELGDHHSETIAALELTTTYTALGGHMESAEQLALGWHARLVAEFGEKDRVTGRVALLLYNLYDSWGRPEEMAIWLDAVRRSRFEPQGEP